MRNQVWFRQAIQYVGWGLFTAALAGCGPATEQGSETKIYGGVKSQPGSWPGAVALTSYGSIFCSGTAIAPRLVVTAAHCVRATSLSAVGVYVGEGKEGGRVSAQYKATKMKASPKYTGGGNDIAYIVLDNDLNLPASAYVPVLVSESESAELLKAGATSRIVGFGNRDDGGFGVKFETDARVTGVSTNEVSIGGSGKDSCQGDSGGPAYGRLSDGQWRVYGVVSRGGACGTGGIYGIMSANICWIQQDSGVNLNLPAGTCG